MSRHAGSLLGAMPGSGIEQGVAPCRVIDPVYGRAQGRRAPETATHSDIEAAVALPRLSGKPVQRLVF